MQNKTMTQEQTTYDSMDCYPIIYFTLNTLSEQATKDKVVVESEHDIIKTKIEKLFDVLHLDTVLPTWTRFTCKYGSISTTQHVEYGKGLIGIKIKFDKTYYQTFSLSEPILSDKVIKHWENLIKAERDWYKYRKGEITDKLQLVDTETYKFMKLNLIASLGLNKDIVLEEDFVPTENFKRKVDYIKTRILNGLLTITNQHLQMLGVDTSVISYQLSLGDVKINNYYENRD